jgi:hypothetical protein
MQTNVGTIDRLVRVIIGVVLLAAVFAVEGSARWFGLIGIVPLVTALLRWCPLYTLLGLNTCPVNRKTLVTDSK